jgi:hypothetical protein
MYCVYMSEEHLADEPASELYGDYIDAEYNWQAKAEQETGDAAFLQDSGETDVDLLTGEASDHNS